MIPLLTKMISFRFDMGGQEGRARGGDPGGRGGGAGARGGDPGGRGGGAGGRGGQPASPVMPGGRTLPGRGAPGGGL